MLSLFLPSHTLSRLAAVALLGVVFAWNTTFAEETPLVIDESPALEVQNVENTPLDVAEILPEVVPEEVISDIIIPESTVVVLVIGADIPFADTPALEPEVLPESLNIPLLGEASGMAAYNTATGELVFTTYLEQNSFELSDALFTRNGEYVLFRTNDSNWCSGLTLDQCRATSTQQATVTITNLIEPEILSDAVVSNEILSVEQGEPAGLADLVETIIPETTLPVIISEDTSSLIKASETLPTDTNTFVPPTTEVLDILLPPSGESTEPLVTEEIVVSDEVIVPSVTVE